MGSGFRTMIGDINVWWLFSCSLFVMLTLLLYCAWKLIYPILNPTIISYPWPSDLDHQQRQKDKTMTVVLAGSFNPCHKGHLAMLVYLSERYKEVIVVVGMNPNKRYLVSPEERKGLILSMLQNSSASRNVLVQVVGGYIWRTVKKQGAQLFVRGIRSWEKDGADERSLQILNTWGPLVLGPLWWPIPTIFLEGKPEFNHVSSTLIRDLCRKGEESASELSSLVPQCIVDDVVRMYSRTTDNGINKSNHDK